MAPLKKVEDRTRVEPGDFVIAELEAFADGTAIPGSKLESRLLEVSDKSIAHGLHEVLTGAEVGVEGTHRRSYPADYGEKDLAGKEVEWHYKVKEIFRRELPALDDEFAKDQGEFQSLAELREKMRGTLLAQAKQDADAKVRQGLLDIVLERNPVEVPQSLIEREMHVLEAEFASALQAGGMAAEQAAEAAHRQTRRVPAPRREARPQLTDRRRAGRPGEGRGQRRRSCRTGGGDGHAGRPASANGWRTFTPRKKTAPRCATRCGAKKRLSCCWRARKTKQSAEAGETSGEQGSSGGVETGSAGQQSETE